jgi:hypothetical protein
MVSRANVPIGGYLILEIKSNIVLFCRFVPKWADDAIADVNTLPDFYFDHGRESSGKYSFLNTKKNVLTYRLVFASNEKLGFQRIASGISLSTTLPATGTLFVLSVVSCSVVLHTGRPPAPTRTLPGKCLGPAFRVTSHLSPILCVIPSALRVDPGLIV